MVICSDECKNDSGICFEGYCYLILFRHQVGRWVYSCTICFVPLESGWVLISYLCHTSMSMKACFSRLVRDAADLNNLIKTKYSTLELHSPTWANPVRCQDIPTTGRSYWVVLPSLSGDVWVSPPLKMFRTLVVCFPDYHHNPGGRYGDHQTDVLWSFRPKLTSCPASPILERQPTAWQHDSMQCAGPTIAARGSWVMHFQEKECAVRNGCWETHQRAGVAQYVGKHVVTATKRSQHLAAPATLMQVATQSNCQTCQRLARS